MKFIAYETVPAQGFNLVPAPRRRMWMDATHERSAYRCLPMLLANQAGWLILNPTTVRVKWDGGALLKAIEVQRWQPHNETIETPDYAWPISHFGSGIVTWTLPYLFRTLPDYNLLVRGPANQIKDGVVPLEGLVETDRTAATATMNWKITRPDIWITFEKDEPICMVVPQRRGELEEFTPVILPIGDDPELSESFQNWGKSRDQFNADRKDPGSQAAKEGWQKDYVRSAVQTRLHLRPFSGRQ